MHKYQPRFHIIRCSEIARIWTHKWKTFQFSEMEFIAVTAYQNEKVQVQPLCEIEHRIEHRIEHQIEQQLIRKYFR